MTVTAVGGAVAAGTPDATGVGQEILLRGGNAADAAVAVSLALGVTEPGQSGLGGTAVALVRPPGGRTPVVIHVPRTGLGADADGGPVAVLPALLPVLERLWRHHGSGSLEWEELVEPAIELAEDGFPLGRLAHRTLVQQYPRLLADEGLTELFLTEKRAIPAEGTVLTRPALASTLRRIARRGPADLYRGELGSVLAGWAGESGFPLERSDLTGAPPAREAEAEGGRFGPWTVWVAPQPFAGPVVLRGLELLRTAPDPVHTAPSEVRTPWMVEALAWAFDPGGSDVGAHLRSLPALPLPTRDTTGPGAGPAPPGSSAPRDGVEPVAGARPASGETTHFSIMDGQGGSVTMTQTLGQPYGAGVPAGELGFVFGHPSGETVAQIPGVGRSGALAGSPPSGPPDSLDGTGVGGDGSQGAAGDPGGRVWMSPVLVVRDDSLQLALGSPGGPRGVSAVIQVVAAWMEAPRTLQEAVSAPRIHVGPGPAGRRGRVYLEGMLFEPADSVPGPTGPWNDTVRLAIEERGFMPTERDTGLYFQGVSPWFGGVNAVGRAGSDWLAAADPRRDGTGRRASESGGETAPVSPGAGGEGARRPIP